MTLPLNMLVSALSPMFYHLNIHTKYTFSVDNDTKLLIILFTIKGTHDSSLTSGVH